jgi:hypothetical protein
MKRRVFGILGLVWALATSGSGQSWTNRFDDPAMALCSSAAIAVDSSGDVFVTGSATGAQGNPDFATVAYSASGAPLWTNWYNGPANQQDFAIAIAVDSQGVVCVTGLTTKTNGFPEFATVAYSISGAPLWTNLYDGLDPEGGQPEGLVAGANGEFVVNGDAINTNGYETCSFVTIAYSSSGVPLWTNSYAYPGPQADSDWGIAAAGNGNLYVAGEIAIPYSNGASECLTLAYSSNGVWLWTNSSVGPSNPEFITAGEGSIYVANDADGDYTVFAYSAAGEPLWTNQYAGPNEENQVEAITVGPQGFICVTGNSYPGEGAEADYATVAYSSNGAALWTNRYDGFGGYNSPVAIAIDAAGNVYVTGSSLGPNDTPGYATIAYTSTGYALWTNRYDAWDNQAIAMAVDAMGSIYVTGNSEGTNYNTGYATIKIEPPTIIVSGGPSFGLSNGMFGFDVYGPANSQATVEISSNLLTWQPLQTLVVTNGLAHFTEAIQTNGQSRFYSVRAN